jgi:hypothetical protein
LEHEEHPAYPALYPIVVFSLGANGINKAVIHIFPVGDGSPLIRFWFLASSRYYQDFEKFDQLIERLTKLDLGEPPNLDAVYQVFLNNKDKVKKAKPYLVAVYQEIERQLQELLSEQIENRA